MSLPFSYTSPATSAPLSMASPATSAPLSTTSPVLSTTSPATSLVRPSNLSRNPIWAPPCRGCRLAASIGHVKSERQCARWWLLHPVSGRRAVAVPEAEKGFEHNCPPLERRLVAFAHLTMERGLVQAVLLGASRMVGDPRRERRVVDLGMGLETPGAPQPERLILD